MCQNADACMHIHHIHRVVLVVVCQSKRAFKHNLCQTNMFKKQLLKKGVGAVTSHVDSDFVFVCVLS